jgi:hypothetical protein
MLKFAIFEKYINFAEENDVPIICVIGTKHINKLIMNKL